MLKLPHPLNLLLLGGILFLTRAGLAAAPDNILDPVGKFKPVIVCSDTYKESVESTRGEPGDPPSRDVVSKQKMSAKIVANLEGFPFGDIDGDLAVGLEVGTFSFHGTLDESDEAAASGFPVGGNKATFSFYGEVENSDPDKEPKQKLGGKVIFSWTETRLTVTMTSTDIDLAGFDEIAASEFTDLYDSTDGTKPSGSATFSNEPNTASVTFGDASGDREIRLKGKSTTKVKTFGSGDNYEEFVLESVTLVGSTDIDSPTITVEGKDTENLGKVTLTITTKEGAPYIPPGGSVTPVAPTVVVFNEVTFEDPLSSGVTAPVTAATDANGLTQYTVEVPLTHTGSNKLYVFATDAMGNTGFKKKSVKTKAVFPDVP